MKHLNKKKAKLTLNERSKLYSKILIIQTHIYKI